MPEDLLSYYSPSHHLENYRYHEMRHLVEYAQLAIPMDLRDQNQVPGKWWALLMTEYGGLV